VYPLKFESLSLAPEYEETNPADLAELKHPDRELLDGFISLTTSCKENELVFGTAIIFLVYLI